MKPSTIIEKIISLKPGMVEEDIVKSINELECIVAKTIMDLDTYPTHSANSDDTDLLIPDQYSEAYVYFVLCNSYLQDDDMQRYTNYMQLYNYARSEFACDYIQNRSGKSLTFANLW